MDGLSAAEESKQLRPVRILGELAALGVSDTDTQWGSGLPLCGFALTVPHSESGWGGGPPGWDCAGRTQKGSGARGWWW